MYGTEALQLRHYDSKGAVARRQLLQFRQIMRCVDLHPIHHEVVREIHPLPVARGDIERDKLLIVGKITLKKNRYFNFSHCFFLKLERETFVVMWRVSSIHTSGRWTGLWTLRQYWGLLPVGSIVY